jgi:hypothetical protein
MTRLRELVEQSNFACRTVFLYALSNGVGSEKRVETVFKVFGILNHSFFTQKFRNFRHVNSHNDFYDFFVTKICNSKF